MIDVLDVIAGLALALVVVSLALAWATRMAWRLMCNLRDEEVEHAHTRRRLADVEAIRQREPVNLAEHPDRAAMRFLEELRMGEGDSVTILCDDPEADSTAKRMAIVCNGAWTQWEDRRFYGESIVQCLARGAQAMRITPVDRTLVPDQPIKPHLKAVDAGGCAPPIIVTVDSDRATDRAYAEAGIMPVADYVAKYGEEPRR